MERKPPLSGGVRGSEAAGPLVSVAVVTWNSEPYLRRCIEGIRHQTHPRIELIAVDNASEDGSADAIAEDAAILIRNGSNVGFAAAVNQAIAVAHGEALLVLNPDCHLLPEYVERLLAALLEAGEDFGAATGMLIRARGHEIEPAGEIDSLGIRMTRSGRHLDSGQGSAVEERKKDDRWFEVFGVSGAAGMFRMTFLRDVAIGGEAFDTDFFAYREDADLAWRGRLFGWKALCEPRAVAWHVRRVTPEVRRSLPPEINMHSVKNRFLLRAKNEGAWLALRNAPFELSRDLVVLAAALSVERASWPAFRWLWRNRSRIVEKRREIQRRRRVGDRVLARWFT